MTSHTSGRAKALSDYRRWLQFSLRSALLVLSALIVCFGWYANLAVRQRRAAALIASKGGKVFYLSEGARHPLLARYMGIDFVDSVVRVQLSGTAFGDDDLRLLRAFPALQWLQLYETKVTGTGFSNVSPLRALEKFDSTRSPLTDYGLECLRGSPLDSIRINDALITDDGIAALPAATIRELGLFGVPITDKAMEHVATCKDLELLFLEDVPITDRGIRYLSTLPRLCNVRLRSLPITDEALLTFADHACLLELKLENVGVTDQGLNFLGHPPNLKFLKLQNTQVTAEGCARIRESYSRGVVVDGPRPVAPPPAAALLP